MKYVLDTNTVAAVMRGEARVLDRLQRSNRRDVVLPQPVLSEIAYGIARLPKSKRRQLLAERFEAVSQIFERIEWSDAVSVAFGEVKALLERKGRRIEDFDVAIAAHVLASDATLVTSNTKHMASIPRLLVEDWLASE